MEPAEEPYRGLGCLYSRDPEHTMGLVLSVPGAELWLWLCLLFVSVSGRG